MAKKTGLGKGFGIHALIPNVQETAQKDAAMLAVEKIEPSRTQPRKTFDREKLEALADSIRENGMVQPIIVAKEKDYYRIVAGERRWRAAKLLGLSEIPAIVRDYSAQQADQIALVENLQRDDLNPMEEASGYRTLMEKHGLTQETVAQKLGKSRPAVANALRLLTLPADVQALLEQGKLSAGHARALLGLPAAKKISALAQQAVKESLSVREVERLVKAQTAEKKKPAKRTAADPNVINAIDACRERLEKKFGSKVKISYSGKFSGKVELPFRDYEQMMRLLDTLDQ